MSASNTVPGRAPASVGYNLAAILLALAFGGLALAYLVAGASDAYRERPSRAATAETLTRTIGGRDLAIPRTWFRYAEQRTAGFVRHVDLRMLLPLGADGDLRPVDVTLLPANRVRPSARLLDAVYLHRFGTDQLRGSPGLIGKPLHGTEGLEGETVWYDPLTVGPFVAKCGAPVTADAASRCLRTVHLGSGLAAVYAFDADLLANWKRFDPAMEQKLEAIGAL